MTRSLAQDTGFFDKILLDALAQHEIAQSRRYGNPLAVAFFGFHDLAALPGETRVTASLLVAITLRNNLRAADIPGHYDDDFLVLMPYTDSKSAETATRRIVEQFDSLVKAKNEPHSSALRMCAGIAPLPTGSDLPAEAVIEAARAALNQARAAGAGRVAFSPNRNGPGAARE